MKCKELLLFCGFCICSVPAVFADFRDMELKSEINSVEPFKGITFWSDNAQMLKDPSITGLEFAYCLPSDVVVGFENGKIQYNWDSFDQWLDNVKSRGHKAVVRFRYEYPSGPAINGVKGATAVPAYIKNMPDYNETYKENPGGDGPTYYADWSHEELLRFTKQFYVDYAEKYDDDPRIAYIQVGFGHWSEYHIYDGTNDPYQYGVNFPTKDYQREFLKHMSENTFKKTPWNISINAGQSHAVAAETAIKALNFGLFDDSFMHANHDIGSNDGYNERLWISLEGTSERYKIAPCGGEISYYESIDQENFLADEGVHGKTWEEAAAKYHMTYVIGNDTFRNLSGTALEKRRARVKEASQFAGYQFTITGYKTDGKSVIVTVENTGIAPIYFDVYPTVKGVQSTSSLKGLLPNAREDFIINVDVSENETPALTITGDKLYEGETIPYQADLEVTTTAIKKKVFMGSPKNENAK